MYTYYSEHTRREGEGGGEALEQPRPQGFSLKKWVERPTHF